MNLRGQVTIFVIIAVIIIGAVIAFFVFRDSIGFGGIPSEFEPVYNTFLSCLEEDLSDGILVLEAQGGYIELPEFESGSAYMPFSSQLDFLGNPIPYWYYVSGNNVQKEQVPSKNHMEEQLEKFIEDKINSCDFEKYYDEGFQIIKGEPNAEILIKDKSVELSLDMDLSFNRGEEDVVVGSSKVSVNSKLGILYADARKVYNYEQDNLFLENYAVDVLRLYAPVDGVEMTCAPLTWNAEEVFDDLGEAIEANTLALKTKSGSYTLGKNDKYFIVDVSTSSDVRFVNSKTWSNNFEVEPADSVVLISNPVGNQPGLGILGFCYVPYHFVYNFGYPVLVQVSDGLEIFQFPVAVAVRGNKPREALDVTASEFELPELCEYKNTEVVVKTFDIGMNPVEADISYECFGVKCEIGKASLTSGLREDFPQCMNGYILARAKGFEDGKYLFSTTESGNVDIILDRLYEKDVVLKLDGRDYTGEAVITFASDKGSKTIVYPEQKEIELSEGQYEVQVYIYKNSSLKLAADNYEQCLEVPDGGLSGFFGATREECFDVEIPEQIISNALAGGGKENYYVLESELRGGSVVEISAGSLPIPNSIEKLQDNYFLFEDKSLGVVFR